jgi:hypothetical protein
MKFSKTILTIAALFAVSTITPMSYRQKAIEVANDPYKYSRAISTLQQAVRDQSLTLKEQLSNPSKRNYGVGSLLLEAIELGIPKEDMADAILSSLSVLKLNAADQYQTAAVIESMMVNNPDLQ